MISITWLLPLCERDALLLVVVVVVVEVVVLVRVLWWYSVCLAQPSLQRPQHTRRDATSSTTIKLNAASDIGRQLRVSPPVTGRDSAAGRCREGPPLRRQGCGRQSSTSDWSAGRERGLPEHPSDVQGPVHPLQPPATQASSNHDAVMASAHHAATIYNSAFSGAYSDELA